MKARLFLIITLITLATTSYAGDAKVPKVREPEAQITELIENLETGDIKQAFDLLLKGSALAKRKPDALSALVDQTKTVFEAYGLPTGYEVVETKKLGSRLINIKFISIHSDDNPMFWNTLFYKRGEHWELLSVYFYDSPNKAGIL